MSQVVTEAQARISRRTYTIPEAGQILGIGRSAAYAAANRGELGAIRVGGRLLVPARAVEQLLAGDVSPAGHEGRPAA